MRSRRFQRNVAIVRCGRIDRQAVRHKNIVQAVGCAVRWRLETMAPRGWRYYGVGCCAVCTGWGCCGDGLLLTASSVMANTSDVTRVSAAITTAVHARGLPRRLVRRCTMPAIRAMRASGAPELQRARRQLRRRQSQRCALGSVCDEPGDRLTILEAGEPPAHQLPAGFGVQIPASPGRALLRNHLHHGLPDFVHHVQRHVVGAQQPSRRLTAEQGARPAGRIRAEQPGCALAPVAGEVRQRLDLLLRSGGECRLGA